MKKIKIRHIVGIIINPLFILFCFTSLRNVAENKAVFEIANILILLKINFILYLLLVLLTCAFYAFFNDVWIGYCVATVCLFLFYVIHYFKLKFTGIPLRPTDFLMVSRAKDLLSFIRLQFDEKIIFCLVSMGLAFTGMYFCLQPLKQQLKSPVIKRFLVFICAIGMIFVCFYIWMNTQEQHELKNDALEDTQNARNSEASYTMNPTQLETQYSQALMEQVLRQVEDRISTASNENVHVEKPNVVVIMSEAFWDPTRLENFTFSRDPIQNFRELSKSTISGNILSPVIGGVTCNVEYEFLVGNSIRFVDGVDVPFEAQNKYIPVKDARAVPWQFKNNGYKTIAIHPFNKFFYNRNLIYPKLGFDEFLSLSDMDNPSIKGEYVSDEYFMQTVIKTMDATEEPLFIFGISMENHYPYYSGKFGSTDVTTESSDGTHLSNGALDSYAQGVYDADQSLKQLIDYIKTQQKPTLVLFFGDHLPFMDVNPLHFYQQTGFISSSKVEEWNLEDVEKMHSVPYLVWANYELPKLKLDNVSPIYLGPMLLDLANLNKNIYASYLLEMLKQIPVLHRDIFINEDGVVYKEPPIDLRAWMDNFFYIQYDSLKYPNHNGGQFIQPEISQYQN